MTEFKAICITCEKKKNCIRIESRGYKNYTLCKKCLTLNLTQLDKDILNKEEVKEFIKKD